MSITVGALRAQLNEIGDDTLIVGLHAIRFDRNLAGDQFGVLVPDASTPDPQADAENVQLPQVDDSPGEPGPEDLLSEGMIPEDDTKPADTSDVF